MLSDEDRALRKKAHIAISDAIKRGDLPAAKTLSCSVCGVPAADYHHADYSKPLEVIPVCDECHGFIHRKEKVKHLCYVLRVEMEILRPLKRHFEDRPKNFRLPNKTKWALRDMLQHVRSTGSVIERALHWIVEEHTTASLSADDDYVVRLGELTGSLADLALNNADMQRMVLDARVGIYTGPDSQNEDNNDAHETRS